MNQAFSLTPCVPRFQFQNWNPKLYNWIFNDEFNIKDYCFEKWKIMVAGERVKIESKYEKSFDDCIQCPMIFISNLDPPVHLVGFQNRVFIVKAINEPGNLLTLIVF